MTDEPADCTCGGPIPSTRRDGFCSSWCAGRDAQGLPPQSPPPLRPVGSPGSRAAAGVPQDGAAGGRAVPQADASWQEAPTVAAFRPERGLLIDRVRRQLADAGVLDEWAAAQALDLAETLSYGGGSGSARAALHRELRTVMGDLLRGAPDTTTSVGKMRDEVADRRARRAARAGGA